mgnify:CR=1 FL=1
MSLPPAKRARSPVISVVSPTSAERLLWFTNDGRELRISEIHELEGPDPCGLEFRVLLVDGSRAIAPHRLAQVVLLACGEGGPNPREDLTRG